MNLQSIGDRLTTRQIAWRMVVVAGIGLGMVALRSVDPANQSWSALHTSCGALTGLPCIFCGTTRAVHHLLNGDFQQALYFNWLAFPVVAFSIAFICICTAEVVLGRRLISRPTPIAVTPRRLAAIAVGLVALWLLQIGLAVGMHKQELLNPSAPLYAFFVR